MIYSDKIRKAMWLLFKAHIVDVDKGGYPYVFHPYEVASKVADAGKGEDAVCVALLHDLIEDHGDEYDFDYLIKAGFGDAVVDALKLLCHDKETDYMEYVMRIRDNELAKAVKIADLEHNSDASRIGGKTAPKAELYKKALEYLKSCNK